MVEAFPFSLAVGTVLGFLGGLGVGGGSLLMLWLTLVLGMTHREARIMNLLFFIPCALVCSLFRWKQGHLNLRKLLPAVAAGCICASLASRVGTRLHPEHLKKIFGGLLLITGLRELLYKPREK